MKTEKKSNEPSYIPSAVVKEDPDGDSVKIKEESVGAGGNNENVPGDEGNECTRDANLDSSNGDANNMPMDSQNGNSNNQPMLSSVKQETDHNNPTDDLTTEGIQPLVSNVINKQMGGGGGGGGTDAAQYVQQQNRVFVFSTNWANEAAKAVCQGHFPSIIAYHCAQPRTKKFIEENPIVSNHFRQNPAQWFNNMAMLKQKNQNQPTPSNQFSNEQPPDLPAIDPTAPSYWNDQPNLRNINGGNNDTNIDDSNIDVPCLVPNSPSNNSNNQTLGQSPNVCGRPTSPGIGGPGQPSLQGVKIPDEDLTPEQRHHRDAKLATLRQLHIKLFKPDNELGGPLDPTQIPTGTNLPATNVPVQPPVTTASGQQCPTKLDWNTTLNPFINDGKNKVDVGSPGTMPHRNPSIVGSSNSGGGVVCSNNNNNNNNNNSGVGGNGNGLRSQGPPPPYHQTTRSASVPIAIQSPNPSSPNNPTSNLSLPSPRASSALNSPADCNRQFQLNPQRTVGHLPGQSPTSQDSPNPGIAPTTSITNSRLNHSNPGTPVSHSHITTLSPNSTPQKDNSLDFTSNQPSNIDGMYSSRTLASLAQQKQQQQQQQQQQHSGPLVKEANLMPVPSPQQIQYLNTFEGQELTIQKQPNTSLKDGTIQSNNNTGNNNQDLPGRILSGNMENNNQFSGRPEVVSPTIDSMSRGFGSMHSPHTPHTPGTAPQTPIDSKQNNNSSNNNNNNNNNSSNNNNNKNSASAQSSPAPMNTNLVDSMGPPRTIPASPNTKQETSSPSSKDIILQQSPVQGQQSNNQGVSQQPMQQQQKQQQQIQQQMQQQQQQQHQQQQQQNLLQNSQQQQQSPLMNQHQNNQNNNSGPPMGSMSQFPCIRPPNSNQSSDNIPLNPNNIGGRIGNIGGGMNTNHFDPITSLAQMSQQLTNTAASNALGNDGSMHPGSGMMFNNHHGMHMMQINNEMNGGCHMGGGPGSGPGPGSGSGPGSGPGPGPGGINEQNDVVGGMCMNIGGGGGPPTRYSPTTSHTGSPTMGVPNKMSHPMINRHGMMPGINPSQGVGYSGGNHIPPPRLMGHVNNQNPYNGTNIQVKPSAPNTIQYLPSHPNQANVGPRGPPSLDFLHRYTNPMGMDTKMSSQSYYGNGCMPNNMSGPHPGLMGPGGLPGMGGGGGGGGHGGPQRMDGQSINNPHQSMRPSLVNMRPQQQQNIMRMQHMVGGGVFTGNSMDPDKVFPSDMVQSSQVTNQHNQQNQNMYGPGNKNNSMGPGPPPDASQPLPPSMGGGPGTFKNSPFVGNDSSMANPHYERHYHQFQQQLYATPSRNSGQPPPPHPNIHPSANSHSHQQFFIPK